MLKDDIRQKTLNNVGGNIYFAYTGSYAYTQAVEAFRTINDNTEFLQFDEKTDVSDIIMMANTISMFVSEKLVMLNGFVKPLSEANKKALLDFLSEHDETITVVICEDASAKKQLSFLSSKCVTFDYSKTGETLATDEIAAVMRERNITISPFQCKTIYNKCQRQLDLAVLEAKKLSFYLNEGDTVKDTDITDCVIDAAERKTYEVADLLSSGKIKEAVTALKYFKVNAVASSFVLATFAAQYRRLLYTSLTKKSDEELAEIFGVKAFSIKSGRAIVAKYKQTQMKRMLEQVYAAEYAFKSGVCGEDAALCDVVGKIIYESATK